MKEIKERNIMNEQRQIAFGCFVKDTKKLIDALNSGKSLADLATNCEAVCNHTCTDGYESEICNINRWIYLLQKALEQNLIPNGNLSTFLEFLILDKTDKSISTALKKFCISFSLPYRDFSFAKHYIIQQLYYNCIFELLLQLENDLNKPEIAYIYEWLKILDEADKKGIIPGNSIQDFLIFI